MTRLPGQAAIGVAMLARALCTLAITLAILGALAVAAIAWRLSQGPVDLSWLTTRIEEAANAHGGPTRLAIGSTSLTWEGFHQGVDRPLDLRLANITVIDQAGGRRISIPRAEVSLSFTELFLLRVVPRTVTLQGPQLTLVRAADGTLSLDLGSLAEATDAGASPPSEHATPVADLLAELAQPPGGERGAGADALFAQLRAVRIQDARVTVVDRQLGVTWQAPQAEINLTRRPEGGVDGTADLSLALGEQTARLTLSVRLDAGASAMHLRARLSPVTPRVIARAAPSLAPLAALDAPVGAEATVELDRSLAVTDARLTLRAGSGRMRIGTGDVPLQEAALVVSGTPDQLTVQALRVSLRGRDGGPVTVIDARGSLLRRADRVTATVSADLDQVDFADLGRLWPDGIAGGARKWLVANIPVGMARNGRVDLDLAAMPDLSSIVVTRAGGTLDGEGLQVHWLRPVPPIDHGKAQLVIVDPDTLDVIVTSGRQRVRNQKETAAGGVQIRSGKMRVTGLLRPSQVGAIEAEISAPLPDVLSVLREPRLHLLDRHPIDVKDPAGQTTAKLSVNLPLEEQVGMDDIAVRVQARLEGVHLGALVAGQDMDQGALDLTATNDGVKVSGRALLASIPTRLDGSVDFRPGPPGQVVQTATVSGQPDARQLAAAGLDATSVMSGPARMQAVLTERRNGQRDIAVTADLTAAELAVEALEWRKPRDASAKASARLLLTGDQLTAVDAVQLDGEGLALRGRAEFSAGRLSSFRVDRLVLGRTVGQGMLTVPVGGPMVVNLTGATIDLSARFGRRSQPQPAVRSRAEPPPGPPWVLDAKFDRVLMAFGRVASNVVLHAQNDGRVMRQLRLDGRTGTSAPFQARIVSDGGARRLTASADDAGELLRGLDYIRSMQGGKLSLQAQYNDAQPGRPLSGTADIDDFRIREAPAFGKLLQAMTLYGLVEVLQGPGLGFSRMVAPFWLTDDALELRDARAFSPSLGLTAKGRIALDAERIDMEGTIVPAYFFNSLLGNIPLVGKLFSPERGGGLFAASYTLRGRLDDPEVFVNPLAALTPGFLRGLFGLF